MTNHRPTLLVVQYLSDEWLQAADAAVREAAESAPPGPVHIDQYIAGGPSYRVSVESGSCAIRLISADDDTTPDAIFRQDRSTAVAVAQGVTDAHQAFLLGQITFEGNTDLLIERRDVFAWLESTLAPLLARTTFG